MKIEQIAIATYSEEQAKQIIENLKTLGYDEWVEDTVTAEGTVFDKQTVNVAKLNFNYQMGFELEIITYLVGYSWHEKRNVEDNIQFPFQSHMGKHATAGEIDLMKKKMEKLGCGIAQEVYTLSHTNPAIAGKRKYHYVVFDSREKLGFDLKLIERIMLDEK